MPGRSDRTHRSRGTVPKKLVWAPKQEVPQETGADSSMLEETEVAELGTTEVSGKDDIAEFSDAESSAAFSIPGDSIASTIAEATRLRLKYSRRHETVRARAQPPVQSHGEDRSRGESSNYNAEPEVGNAGCFCGAAPSSLIGMTQILQPIDRDMHETLRRLALEWLNANAAESIMLLEPVD